MTSYVGSFEDVPKALEMTKQLYNQGAQIVFAPASQSILGAVTAASDSDKYLIGCDQDIWAQVSESDPESASVIISSALKKVGDSLFTAASGFFDGSMTTDKNYTLGLKSGAVGLAENENFITVVPEEIRARLGEISELVMNGEIVVGTSFSMETDAIAKLRDEMKP